MARLDRLFRPRLSGHLLHLPIFHTGTLTPLRAPGQPEAKGNFMFAKTRNVVRRYGAKVGAAGTALVASGMAMAQEASTADTIVSNVEAAFSKGELIAGAIVLGLFTIYGIKLLWRSK